MKAGSRRAGFRQLLTVLALATLAGGLTAGTARADDDHDRGHQDRQWRNDDRNDEYDYQREQVQQDREWRHRGRVYYGRSYYADPPPAVIYVPPPQPYGLNLLFNLGR